MVGSRPEPEPPMTTGCGCCVRHQRIEPKTKRNIDERENSEERAEKRAAVRLFDQRAQQQISRRTAARE